MRMQLVKDGESFPRWLMAWIIVSIASAIALSLVTAMHLISAVMALGIWSVITFGAGVLLRYRLPDTSASLKSHRRFILIYAGCGVFAASKAITAGWSKDDTIGVFILVGVLVLCTFNYFQRKKSVA